MFLNYEYRNNIPKYYFKVNYPADYSLNSQFMAESKEKSHTFSCVGAERTNSCLMLKFNLSDDAQ